MTEQHSPWARPPAGSDESGGAGAYPSNAPVLEALRQGRPTADAAAARAGARSRTGSDDARPRTGRAGTVTRLGRTPVEVAAPAPGAPDPARRRKRTLLWFGGSAVAGGGGGGGGGPGGCNDGG